MIKTLTELATCFTQNAPTTCINGISSAVTVMDDGITILGIDGTNLFVTERGELRIWALKPRHMNRLFSNTMHYEIIINAVVSKYNKAMGIPPMPRIKLRFTDPEHYYFSCGKDIIPAPIDNWLYYPFKKGSPPAMSTEIKNLFKFLGNSYIPRPDSDIEFLGRAVEDSRMLSFLPKDRLKHLDIYRPADKQRETLNKYMLFGKPVKIMKKAFYMTKAQEEKFLSVFRVPELTFTEEPKENIPAIYMTHNYGRSHTLGGSCMNSNHSVTKEYFKIYEKVARGILVAWEGEKVIGRALLWDVKIEGKDHVVMDRIYASDFSYESSFMDYARKKGWYRKAYQDFKTPKDFIDPDGHFVKLGLEIKMYGYVLPKVPYCDTFRYLKKNRTRLSNSIEIAQSWGDDLFMKMQSMHGTWSNEANPQYVRPATTFSEEEESDIVWSDWYQDHIARSEAIQTHYGDWIYEDDAANVGGDIYHMEDDDIVWSEYLGEYIYSDDAAYVEDIDQYVPLDDTAFDDVYDRSILVNDAVTLTDGMVTHASNTVLDDISDGRILQHEAITLSDGRVTHRDNVRVLENGTVELI
jgi:hypothetical protein